MKGETLYTKFPLTGLGPSSSLVVLVFSVKSGPCSVMSVVWRKKEKKRKKEVTLRVGHSLLDKRAD